MKSFSSILLILQYLTIINSESLNEESREGLPIAVSSTEENDTNTAVGGSVGNAGLSSQVLSELHGLAKNISHSKGIYRQTDKESSDEQELRRSILKKVTVASESDAIRDILQKFNSNENKLKLLQQIEFLVHQYDVAVDFAAVGGIETITPFLFSSDDEIASSVASVLGAAMQSNPTVQQFAVKHDVGTSLFKLLSHKSPNVLSRIIFALSSLLRNFPEAQEEFLAKDGTQKLADILKNHQIATNTKLKIINLFSDLAVEQQTAEFYPNDRSSEEIQKFKRLFAHEMQSCDICKIVPAFLDLEDFDTHQKIVAAMTSLHSVCYKDFKNEGISNRLNKLLKIYDPESDGETPLYPNIDKDLRQVLYSEIQVLFKRINEGNSSKVATKSELKLEL